MSGGWIKMEKDLRDDVRVRRMAIALATRFVIFDTDVTQDFALCNAGALPGVTLVLGGLQQLWMHADSFARDDDSLDITADEIDQLTGIKGFAKILPADWLQILDEHSVKLPGFQEHNGTEAKRKALTAKRVTRHRIKSKLRGVATCNALALPDQDQTKTRPRPIKTKNAAAPPAASTAPKFNEPEPTGLDPIAWGRWLEYRVDIRKPLKPASIPAAQRQLARFGADQAAIVEQSIANGWQGLFALKGQINGSAKPLEPVRTWRPEPGNDETAEEGYRASA